MSDNKEVSDWSRTNGFVGSVDSDDQRMVSYQGDEIMV